MTYQEIIQKTGKEIEKKIYYYDDNNNKVYVGINNIESISIGFNSDVIGTLMKYANLDLKEEIASDKLLYIELKVTFSNNQATKIYGPFYIKEIEYNGNDKIYSYQCYDKMLKTMVEYEPIEITYPTTIQNYFNELIQTLGFTSDVILINGNLQMTSDIYTDIGYSYRSVIQDIAEANGILLYIDTNEIKEANLGTETTVIDDDILKNTNVEFGKHFGPINTIVLSRSADSDNIYYPTVLPSNPKEFKISDNQLMNNDDRVNFIQGLYTKLNGIEFDIFDTELVGFGGFEPLQKIKFTTGDNEFYSYVLNNDITITDGYDEVIYTDEPAESVTDYKVAATEDDKVNQVSLIVNKQQKTINGLITKTNNIETDVNKTIKKIDVEYYLSTSLTELIGGTWSTVAPEWEEDKYMWSRTKSTFVDGTVSTSQPTCIAGAKGDTGEQGEQGEQGIQGEKGEKGDTGSKGDTGAKGDTGPTGVGVESITEQYYLSTSNTTQTGGSWSNDQPNWTIGYYIWTRSHIVWSNNTSSNTTPVLAQALNTANETANTAQTSASDATTSASNAYGLAEGANNKIDTLDYVSTEALAKYNQTIETTYAQKSDGFEYNFNTIINRIQSEVASGINDSETKLQKYIRFVNGSIELGEVGNAYTLKIENDKIRIYYNGTAISSWVQDTLDTKELKLGNFKFLPRENGSLGFRKVD